jgi:hypothetical protein
MSDQVKKPARYVVIFRPYFTDRHGKRHYPPPGRKAWPLKVRVK